jgi:hypothetical protein
MGTTGAVTAAGDGEVAWAATAPGGSRATGSRARSLKAVGEVCQARKSAAGLTQLAARRWGNGANRRGGGRRWWS